MFSFLILNSRYNERAKKWVEEGLESFRDVDFSVSGQKMDMDTTVSGKYYPVRDSCDKEDDPVDKCVYTEALYYKTSIPLSPFETTITIMSDGEELVSSAYRNTYSEIYTASDLGCSEEESECISECNSKDGEWDYYNEYCTVTYYLNSVCYRVAKENDKYKLDIPPYVLFYPSHVFSNL